ncbi:MAG TPA: hypothetical protein EYQ00_15130 [Dehalococcoidia bacterium]|jgi:hypothetical protein|nr:hypothetical protein [Dehalococcoidia bacterium]
MRRYLLVVTILALGVFCDASLVHATGGLEAAATNQGLILSDTAARIFFYGLGGALILLGLAGVGYLYRVNRGLSWKFQQSDSDYSDDGH